MKMMVIMMILIVVVFVICSVALISLFGRKNATECFYVEDNILHLNSLFIKKIPLSDIDHIEFKTLRFRTYRGLMKIHKKNSKVVKHYFQTSKMVFFITEQMVLEEIEKITPILKRYSIPYTINK
ncbi:hypothetical protein FNSP10_17340 [Fusobacterium nucleatum]|uniref:hypothetical protein n=1 Tax=Fusobacterium nucleatum subsp. polymorphum TaxID=76857 RepID=UPI00291E658D|nr:hypothetical protein FNCP10_06960 [Fusobacterium nucleatum]BEP08360.1 hypothetical protein FNSP10_17340 [Fusobacterium nucleatum]